MDINAPHSALRGESHRLAGVRALRAIGVLVDPTDEPELMVHAARPVDNWECPSASGSRGDFNDVQHDLVMSETNSTNNSGESTQG